MSWRWEMCDNGKWISNAVRFPTNGEAEAYGNDLAWRWTAMPTPARVAYSDDPVNYRFIDGKLEAVKTPEERLFTHNLQ